MSEDYRDCTNCKYRFGPKGPCGDCGGRNWEPRKEPAAMSYQERIAEARRLCKAEETLAMLAEEAAELAQAALKLRRALGYGIPTGEMLNGCWGALREEMADVQICVDMLSGAETVRTVKLFEGMKSIKMLARLRKRGCGMTNWEKKFSTPEKTAETLKHECDESDYCGACPLASNHQYCGRILEWLHTEAGEETPCADCEIDYNDKEDGR